MEKLKLVFVTGTRADYGKLKSLMLLCDADETIETYIYVTGMHLLPEYGFTYDDIMADGYKNVVTPKELIYSEKMDENLAYTILGFSAFVRELLPDYIVVHGDRTDPLAASMVGVLNNVRVAHIEGGEITGTVDEFIRHAVSKLSCLHFVANDESKFRLIQLGEREDSIFPIGSPDVDIMLSKDLPALENVKANYGIGYDRYAIFIYHPVTTANHLEEKIGQVVSALCDSNQNYIVVYPNNDHGSEIIRRQLNALEGCERFKFFKSLPFEDFLVLLKNSDFIIGNSSAGIREACVYGIPAIDIGTRQNKRYSPRVLKNVQHTVEDRQSILNCIASVDRYRYASSYFGSGQSAKQFLDIIKSASLLDSDLQKVFVELNVTSESIQNYINEVCF